MHLSQTHTNTLDVLTMTTWSSQRLIYLPIVSIWYEFEYSHFAPHVWMFFSHVNQRIFPKWVLCVGSYLEQRICTRIHYSHTYTPAQPTDVPTTHTPSHTQFFLIINKYVALQLCSSKQQTVLMKEVLRFNWFIAGFVSFRAFFLFSFFIFLSNFQM